MGAQHSHGFRPKRRCAAAIDQGFKVLRQKTSATWSLEGAIQGVFAPRHVAWLEAHIPMPKGVLSTWLRRGFIDRGALFAATAGVPPGGMISPVVSKMVWEGLEAVVHGGNWPRRVHHITSVRGADALLVSAKARQV